MLCEVSDLALIRLIEEHDDLRGALQACQLGEIGGEGEGYDGYCEEFNFVVGLSTRFLY